MVKITVPLETFQTYGTDQKLDTLFDLSCRINDNQAEQTEKMETALGVQADKCDSRLKILEERKSKDYNHAGKMGIVGGISAVGLYILAMIAKALFWK